jgi:hypothetical protein
MGISGTIPGSYKEVAAVASNSAATFPNYVGLVADNDATTPSAFLRGSTGVINFQDGPPSPRSIYTNNGAASFSFAAGMNDVLAQVRSTCATASPSALIDIMTFGKVYIWVGSTCEILCWPNQLSAPDITTLYNSQKTYWGTP